MRDDQGYIVKACCENPDQGHRVDRVQAVCDHPYLQDIRSDLDQGTWPSACESCRVAELAGQHSHRTRSRDLFGWTDHEGELYWNIRPDNACNLACVQCNPVNSSRWERDRDLYQSHTGDPTVVRATADLSWAESQFHRGGAITLLGGEPLASETSLGLLERVSLRDRQGLDLIVTTNAVTLHPRVDRCLEGWRRILINCSIDALGEQFELLRWPGRWSTAERNIREFEQRGCYVSFSVTASALNWCVLPELLEWIGDRPTSIGVLTDPQQFQLNSLPWDVVEPSVVDQTRHMVENHTYDPHQHCRMQAYLRALDSRRGTDSQRVLPWCW